MKTATRTRKTGTPTERVLEEGYRAAIRDRFDRREEERQLDEAIDAKAAELLELIDERSADGADDRDYHEALFGVSWALKILQEKCPVD